MPRLTCVLCGKYHPSMYLHLVYPEDQGGEDEPENLVLLCWLCKDRVRSRELSKLHDLGQYLARQRQDVLAYIDHKLGHPESDLWMVEYLRLFSDEADRILSERYGDTDGVVWWASDGVPVDMSGVDTA